LVAIQQGEKVRNITLFIFGGVAQIGAEPDTPRKEFLIALVGPLTSIAISIVSGMVWWLSREISTPVASIARYLSIINGMLAFFNLIPGFPLDGGRMVRSLIWGVSKNLKLATQVASFSGKVVAFLLILWGVKQIFSGLTLNGIWMIFIGWFLYTAAVSSYRHLLFKDALREVKVEDLMITNFETVPPHITIQQLVDDYLLRHRDRGFLVVENGLVQGIICLHDVKNTPRERWSTTTIKEIMIPKDQLEKVSPGDDASMALEKLSAKNIHQIPVVQENRVKGLLRRNDIINYLQFHTEVGVKPS
jgi:Zn-dependent protease